LAGPPRSRPGRGDRLAPLKTHVITRELPLPPAEAYAWLTDYGSEDRALLGTGTAREAKRLDEGRWELRDSLKRDDWESELRGVVELQPPDRWRYAGRLFVFGEEMGAYEARYRLEPAGSGSKIVVELEVAAQGEVAQEFIEMNEQKMWARFERIYDRIVSAMKSRDAE